MTLDIKRILYATDLSENSAYVFGHASSTNDRHRNVSNCWNRMTTI